MMANYIQSLSGVISIGPVSKEGQRGRLMIQPRDGTSIIASVKWDGDGADNNAPLVLGLFGNEEDPLIGSLAEVYERVASAGIEWLHQGRIDSEKAFGAHLEPPAIQKVRNHMELAIGNLAQSLSQIFR